MSNEWRRVVAALANAERRTVYAALVVGATPDIPAQRLEKALAALADAGLVSRSTDGTPTVIEGVFAELLAAEPEVRRDGVDRFIRDGRIEQYPAKPAQRREILEWAVATLPPGDHTEAALNQALCLLVDDFASLRRYLVDESLLERTPDGSSYRRT
ncbi:DUF2087 domain-containing protein [Glaciihabitans arcticus]|uniref:DUF2087 domain-containing protein n=1 Tax=Glaciihabitans arcticus TaxID=2668039 RepID=A0A4Q9GTL4_9MICO|nr:DUF2087 domain-containing protein [Glaciihabitans arcticus]TBN58025.1 DUF2087 domain-containing protein [Glaciihabitans arcticus]